MTPAPNDPQFIRHEVPNDAHNGSKQIANLFSQLREDIINNKWNYFTKDDILLNYNTNSGITEVILTYKDANNHLHSFNIQFLPDDGWGNTHEDIYVIIYSFEGNFNENEPKARSFVNYISLYLNFEGFEVTPSLHPYTERNKDNKYIVKYTENLSIYCKIENIYSAFCSLIDIIISKLKPLDWFYTEEPTINSYEEVCYYLEIVCAQLRLQTCKGRWTGVNPEDFKLYKIDDAKEAYLVLTYTVNDVWDINQLVTVIQLDDHQDLCCCLTCHPKNGLHESTKSKLHTLFADFLTTLKIAKGNVYVNCGDSINRYVNINYFHIEDTFDNFCVMLDEVVPALQSYQFHLPTQPIKLSERIEDIKNKLEDALNTTFNVETEEDEINKKLLSKGYFK